MAATIFVLDATLLARTVSFDSGKEAAVSKYHAILDVLKNYVAYNLMTSKRRKDELAFVLSGFSGTVEGDPPLDQLNSASAKMLEALHGTKDLEVNDFSKFELVNSIIFACKAIEERASQRQCKGTKIIIVTDGHSTRTVPFDGPKMVELGEKVSGAIQELSCSFEFLLVDCEDSSPLLCLGQKLEIPQRSSNGVKAECGDKKEMGAGEVLQMFRSNKWTSRVHVIDSWQNLNSCIPHHTDFSIPKMGTSKLSGSLYITPSLKIDVKTYAKVHEEGNIPTPTKLSKFAPEDSDGKVDSSLIYKSVDNPDEEVPRDHVIDSYPYGGSLVPINSEDQKTLQMQTEAGIHVLGYYDHKEIPPQTILAGDVDIVVPPERNDRAQQALRAFQKALRNQKYVAMVRYVKKKGKDPALAVLKPSFTDPNDNFLYLCTLPFSQDVRRFKFDPLPVSSLNSEEKKAALDIVDALNLEKNSDGQNVLYNPEQVYNPITEHFRSCLINRGLSGRDWELPATMPHRLSEVYRANKAMIEKSADQLSKFASTFEVKERASVKRGWGNLQGNKGKDPGPYRKNFKLAEEKKKLMDQLGLTSSKADGGENSTAGATSGKRDVEDNLFASSNEPSNASELFGMASKKSEETNATEYIDDDDEDDDLE